MTYPRRLRACVVLGLTAASLACTTEQAYKAEPIQEPPVWPETQAMVALTTGRHAASEAWQRDNDLLAAADWTERAERYFQTDRGLVQMARTTAAYLRQKDNDSVDDVLRGWSEGWRHRLFSDGASDEATSWAANKSAPPRLGADLVPLSRLDQVTAFLGKSSSPLDHDAKKPASEGETESSLADLRARKYWRLARYRTEPPKGQNGPKTTAHFAGVASTVVAATLTEACRIDLRLRHDFRVLTEDSVQLAKLARNLKGVLDFDLDDPTQAAGRLLAPWSFLRRGEGNDRDWVMNDDVLRELCRRGLAGGGVASRVAQWLSQDPNSAPHPANEQAAWLLGLDHAPEPIAAAALARTEEGVWRALDWQRAREWNTLLRFMGFDPGRTRENLVDTVVVNIAGRTVGVTTLGEKVVPHPAIVGNPRNGGKGSDGVLTPVQLGGVASDGALELFPNRTVKPKKSLCEPGYETCGRSCSKPHGPGNPLGPLKLPPQGLPLEEWALREGARQSALAPLARVYIHSTQRVELFKQSMEQRAVSHGCVRASPAFWQDLQTRIDVPTQVFTCLSLAGATLAAPLASRKPMAPDEPRRLLARAVKGAANPSEIDLGKLTKSGSSCIEGAASLHAKCGWPRPRNLLFVFGYFPCSADRGDCTSADLYGLNAKAMRAWDSAWRADLGWHPPKDAGEPVGDIGDGDDDVYAEEDP